MDDFMKHILVAMDLSGRSDRAFERALILAQAHGAELTVSHIIDEQVMDYDRDSGLEDSIRECAKAKLERHWANLPESSVKRINLAVKVGAPWESILAEADAKRADLIVLGLHGKDALRDMFVGTTAERVIRHSVIPVLVVKEKPTGEYRFVVAATDFSPCSAHALGIGLELAPEADFRLVHVFETPFPNRIRFRDDELESYKRPFEDRLRLEAKQAMDAFMSGHSFSKASIKPILERDETIPGVLKIVREQDADLLVMGTHGGTGIVGNFIGSYALYMLNAPPCDMLITH